MFLARGDNRGKGHWKLKFWPTFKPSLLETHSRPFRGGKWLKDYKFVRLSSRSVGCCVKIFSVPQLVAYSVVWKPSRTERTSSIAAVLYFLLRPRLLLVRKGNKQKKSMAQHNFQCCQRQTTELNPQSCPLCRKNNTNKQRPWIDATSQQAMEYIRVTMSPDGSAGRWPCWNWVKASFSLRISACSIAMFPWASSLITAWRRNKLYNVVNRDTTENNERTNFACNYCFFWTSNLDIFVITHLVLYQFRSSRKLQSGQSFTKAPAQKHLDQNTEKILESVLSCKFFSHIWKRKKKK